MSGKQTAEQATLGIVEAHPGLTAAEVAEAAGIGRSSAAKQLAALERAGKVTRRPGGREGGRRLPDRWALASKGTAATAKPQAKGSGERLRPGQLDGLVLSYMQEHKDIGPLSASAIGKGIARSSGAVANCLARLAKAEKVRLAKKSPVATRSRGRARDERLREAMGERAPRVLSALNAAGDQPHRLNGNAERRSAGGSQPHGRSRRPAVESSSRSRTPTTLGHFGPGQAAWSKCPVIGPGGT